MQNLLNSVEAVKVTHDVAALRGIKALLERETASLEDRLVSASKSVENGEKREEEVRKSIQAATERLSSVNSQVREAEKSLAALDDSAKQARIQEKQALEAARAAKSEQDSEKAKLEQLRSDLKSYKAELDDAKRQLRIAESEKRVVIQDTDKRLSDAQAREAMATAKEQALLKLLESTGIKLPESAKPKEQNVTVKI